MKTAVIYARYSCDQQTEQSIEGQLSVCEEYAKRNNILILETYIDRAMTGTNDCRPDFQRMIKDSAKRKWNYVLVYKLDRFSRDKYATAIHKKTLKDNGVKVLSAIENIPDTPEGIILESLLEGMNQYYSAELSQKVKRGMRETRKKGNYQGGGLPYGYKAENKKVIIDEYQAEVVRYMYAEYSKGVYVRDIVNALTRKGVLYKGRPFAMNTVYGILKNDKYSGTYKHEDEIVDNIYPRIVPQEIIDRVRAKIKSNVNGKRSIETVYLLRHKIKCGYCGQSIIAECGTSKSGKRKYYYKCHGRKNLHNGCAKAPVRKDILEDFIIERLIAELSKPQTMTNIINGILKMQDEQLGKNSTLLILEKEYKQIENSLNNIVSAIEQGIITNTTNKRLRELESRQQELERLIAIEKSKTDIKLTEKEIRLYYETALKLEPMLMIEYLVKEVVLFDDKIQIYFNSPIRKSPDNESQGFIICDKIVKILEVVLYTTTFVERNIRLIISI